jgi:hypothetical protein
MRGSLVLTVSLSLATAAASNATAQDLFNTADSLTRSLQSVLQRTNPVTAPLPAPQPTARKALSETDFASVLVGVASDQIGYKFVLLATVPAVMDPSDESKIRRSIPPLMGQITANLQNQIDQLPEFSTAQAGMKPEDLNKRLSSYSDDIQKRMKEAFSAASADFRTQFGSWSPKYVNDSSLAVALRPCVSKACSFGQLATPRAKYWLSRFYDWTNSKGLKAVNQAYVMNSDGSFVAIVAALEKGREWHDDFPKALLQAAFANAAKQSRLTKSPLSYSAAELAGLSKENVAHLADVFDLPYAAAARLNVRSNASEYRYLLEHQ